MTKEKNYVQLRGVTSDLNRSLGVSEPQYPTEIKRIGQVLANKLGRISEITLAWLEKQYPWINKADVCIRSKKSSEEGISGDTFKGMKAFEIGSQVHFDDSVSSVAQVLQLSKAGSILFPRSLESGKFAGNERVVELPDMNLWLKLFGLHQDY